MGAVVLTAATLAAGIVAAPSASAALAGQEYAVQLVNSGRVTGSAESMAQLRAWAAGSPRVGYAGRQCLIDGVLLEALAQTVVTKGHSIHITSLNRYCTNTLTDSGTDSYHWRAGGGHAVDIGIVDGVSSTGATAQDRAFITDFAAAVRTPAAVGQRNCRSASPLTLPVGVAQIIDDCNHVHLEYRGTASPADPPVTPPGGGDGPSTPGLARFGGNTWTIYTTGVSNGTGVTYRAVTWSGTLATDKVLVGDWDGGGEDTPGLARFGGNTWTFYTTDVANGTGVTSRIVTWPGTMASDKPLVGDWNGDGWDTPGLARFGNNTWTFYTTDQANGTGVTSRIVEWPGTLATDTPLVGDWDGDGWDTPGLARFSGTAWTIYTTDVANGTGVTYRIVTWPGTMASDTVLVGDWDNDSWDTPGLARFGGNTWTFYTTDVANGTGVTHRMVAWPGTMASDARLVGDWVP